MRNDSATNASAQLLYDIGVDVNMDYSPDGSFADLFSAFYAFKYKYGYGAARSIVHDINIVHDELKARRPVYMQGTDPDLWGHAWVCDGYYQTLKGVEYSIYLVESTYGLAPEPTEVTYMVGSDYQIVTSPSTYYYHMNWGIIGINNGFYIGDQVSGNGYDFSQSRYDIINIYPTAN